MNPWVLNHSLAPFCSPFIAGNPSLTDIRQRPLIAAGLGQWR